MDPFCGVRCLIMCAVLLDFMDFCENKPLKNEKCEYDLDLVGNNIRVVCQGKSAKVNIYASNAEMKTMKADSQMPLKGMIPQRDSAQQPRPHHHHHRVDYSFVSPLSVIVTNATKKLERLKRKLSRHSIAMTNISTLVAAHDERLLADLDEMRRMQYDSVILKDHMLASIQNQYNFIRTAILTQNAELSKMMDSLQLMVDVTSKSLQSAARSENELFSQITVVNQTMVTMRRMLSKELKKRRRRPMQNPSDKGVCPKQIMAIGAGEVIPVKGKRGTFMKDVADDTGTIYTMRGARGSDRLVEYESELDLEYAYSTVTFDLSFKCYGTCHVVYQGCLYCQKEGTSKIIKYKLDRLELLGELDVFQKGSYENHVNINLAVDEFGLWVIYTTPESAGKIMISKISDTSFTIENTWLTSYPRSSAGNTFMICGILYAVESFSKTPTYIKYMFDTATSKDVSFKEGSLVFPALEDPTVEMSTLAYNYKDGALYAWGGSKVYVFYVFLGEGSRTG